METTTLGKATTLGAVIAPRDVDRIGDIMETTIRKATTLGAVIAPCVVEGKHRWVVEEFTGGAYIDGALREVRECADTCEDLISDVIMSPDEAARLLHHLVDRFGPDETAQLLQVCLGATADYDDNDGKITYRIESAPRTEGLVSYVDVLVDSFFDDPQAAELRKIVCWRD